MILIVLHGHTDRMAGALEALRAGWGPGEKHLRCVRLPRRTSLGVNVGRCTSRAGFGAWVDGQVNRRRGRPCMRPMHGMHGSAWNLGT